MLRWCRSSYRISQGYGVRNVHSVRSRSEVVDASETTSGKTNTIRAQPVATVIPGRDAVQAERSTISTLYYYYNRLAEGGRPQPAWYLSLLQSQELPVSLANATNMPAQLSRLSAASASRPATLFNGAASRPTVPARKRIDSARRSSASLLPLSQRAGKLEDEVALSQLTRYLKPENIRTTVFSESLVDQVVVLYRSCRSTGSLRGLSKEDYAILVTLCGRISASSPGPTIVRRAVQVSETAGEGGKVYWDVVVEVMEDRCRLLGDSVTGTERYWRFQGLVHFLGHKGTLSTERSRHIISLITEDYSALRETVLDEAFHLAYFRALIMPSTTFDVSQAAGHLCDHLESRFHPSPSFTKVFWQFLRQNGEGLPSSIQERFIAIVARHDSSASPASGPCRSAEPTTRHNGNTRRGRSHDSLACLLASCISERSRPEGAHSALLAWALEEASAAFAPHQPVCDRWDNLLLLANALVTDNIPQPPSPSPTAPLTSKWRAVLLLSILGKHLEHVNPSDTTSEISQLSTQIDSLWKAWIQSTSPPPPIEIERAALSTFLKTVVLTGNTTLLEECTHYCFEHNLTLLSADSHTSTIRDVTNLVAAYIHAKGTCKGYYWGQLLEDAAHLLSNGNPIPNDRLLSAVLHRLLPHEFHDAYALYQFSLSKNVQLSAGAVVPLAIALAQRQKWSVVIPLLSSDRFNDRQIEAILVSALKTFQTSRYEVINAALAKDLGLVMQRLYSTNRPSLASKFPVRYFFRLLIVAGHAELAVRTIKSIFAHDPSFFTQRCVRRWLVQLVQRQSPRQAMTLFKISQPHFTMPQVIDMRRKLLTALMDSRETALARKLTSEPSSSASSTISFKQSTKERLLRLLLRLGPNEQPRKVTLKPSRGEHLSRTTRTSRMHSWHKAPRPTPKPRLEALKVMSIINADPRPSPASIRTAVSILARHGPFLAARKLLGRAKHADRKEVTAMGNIILHGWLTMHQAEKAGGVRRVFQLLETLESGCGFRPDRTTMNILAKAILANESRYNSDCLRSLFDSFVQQGYPVTERWMESGGRVFAADGDDKEETSQAEVKSRWVEKLPWAAVADQPYSSLKHVQPLYKMFIKHFHRIGDIRAAQKVVGILKEEQYADLERREANSRARRLGVIRKKAREHGS